MNDVFITKASTYLPNEPVSNDEMETYLGYINDKPSKARALILRNNKITTRYYALDKEGKPTHTNAQITAKAVEGLLMKILVNRISSCFLAELLLQIRSSLLMHPWFTESLISINQSRLTPQQAFVILG